MALCLSFHASPSSSSSSPGDSPSLEDGRSIANLARQEYILAVESNSYNEMWSTIDRHQDADSPEILLQPDADCVDGVLRLVKPGPLTRLVSDYFHHSEATAGLCFGLQSALRRTRSLYSPLLDLLKLVDPDLTLTHHQCHHAFQILLQFDALGNPFLSPDSSSDFNQLQSSFSELKHKLQARQSWSRSSALFRLLLCRVSPGAAAASAVRSLTSLLQRSARKEVVRAREAQLEAVVKGTYVVHDLHTVDSLVALLRSTVDEDKHLVSLALAMGSPEAHLVREVLKQLRKNNLSFVTQLDDLEEHLCLCFKTINKSRSHLLQNIYTYQTLLLRDK